MAFKPAKISKGSFAFCRATIAILLWISIISLNEIFVYIVGIIMILSAIFKVERAPLILLYKYTVDKIKPSENIIVDEKGIFFSHVVGGIFSIVCILLIHFANPIIAWIITGIFALLQTSAAFGFCSALKLYTCMSGGNCCRFGKTIKKVRDKDV